MRRRRAEVDRAPHEPITDISIVMITKNEEATLAATLSRLQAFDDVIIVDSGSTDRTPEIAQEHGARLVDFEWDGHYPKKKQWSLDHSGARNPWVLLLDADEYPSPELLNELAGLAPTLATAAEGAFDIDLTYQFAGTYLKHGRVITKRSLLRTDRVRFPEMADLEAPGIREVEGHYQPETSYPIGRLSGRIVHDDRDPLSSWFDRHNRYSDWEAYLRTHADVEKEVRAKRTAKGRAFAAVPLKAPAFFLYSYIARAGFLDGRAGFDYAVALSTYYWQIELKTRELHRNAP